MLESSLNLLHGWRAATLAAGLAIFAVAAWLATGLSVNDAPERWMPANTVEAWHQFAEHFDYGDSIAVAAHFHHAVENVATELPSLLGAIRSAGAEVDDLRIEAPTLQAVFIHLTGRELRE